MEKNMKNNLTCGEFLVQQLEAYGIDTIFGIPGVHTIEFYRGLKKTSIRHISPRHEQGAGFMADGYARASGKIAACFVITGPGLTNIATAMAQAYADSIPMLVISSVNPRSTLGLGQGRLHELPNQQALASGFCAFSHTLMSPDELPEVLAQAFTILKNDRPRPVHIEIPLDVIVMEAQHLPIIPPFTVYKPAPSQAAIQESYHLLKNAQQPILLLGGGCSNAQQTDLIKLAEAFDMPVVYTVNAKGTFPHTHSLALGSNQATIPVRELAAKADVVLAIGTELGETDYDTVFNGQFIINGQLIRVDIDNHQLQSNYISHVGIMSDANEYIKAMVSKINFENHQPRFIEGQSEGFKSSLIVKNALSKNYWPVEHSYHQVLLDILKDNYPDGTFIGDATQVIYSGNHFFEAEKTHQWFNTITGYATLGYALPAAIGAIISGKQHVFAIIGDGGVQFSMNELATAVEEQIPLVVILWNNNGYKEIKKYMTQNDIETIGVDLYTPDFVQIAYGFGCDATILKTIHDLPKLLAEAVTKDKPTVIIINEDALYLELKSN